MFLGCSCERTLSFAVFPCGKRVMWSSSGRRPTDLRLAQSCQGPTDNVNAIFVNRPFQFNKRSQLFIGAHDETFSVVTVCVNNPDCSPALRDAFSVFVPDINTNRSVGRLKCFSRKTSGV